MHSNIQFTCREQVAAAKGEVVSFVQSMSAADGDTLPGLVAFTEAWLHRVTARLHA